MTTKTRSDVKWLINEIAVLNGDLARMNKQAVELKARQAATAQAHAACLRTLALIVAPTDRGPGRETSLASMLPAVNAKRRYGGWGSLRAFLRETIRLRAPDGIETLELALLAAEEFRTTFATLDEFDQFKDNSVGNVLRYFRKTGVVEYAEGFSPCNGRVSKWRWSCPVPSIAMIISDVRPLPAS